MAPTVVAAIEWRRIPFARMRMELSRRHWGLAPSHPSHSSSSVAVAIAAVAAVAAVTITVAVAAAVHRESLSLPRSLGPSRPMAGATMPPDWSVRRGGVIVDYYAADGAPDSAGMSWQREERRRWWWQQYE